MKKRISIAAALLLVPAGMAAGHPTSRTFDSRGECEAAFAQASNFDREFVVALGFADTIGAAQQRLLNRFNCEYDEDADVWRIVDYGVQP